VLSRNVAAVLIHGHDASDDWRSILTDRSFGQVIAPGVDRDLPIVAPCHFAFDGANAVLTHFARANPIWAAFAEAPRALLAVVADEVYIPGRWNAPDGTPPEHGVPTSYYAAVHATCRVEVVDDPDDLAAILRTTVDHLDPDARLAAIAADAPPYGRLLGAIRGARLTITDVVAKEKYGGNRTPEHRRRIAEALVRRAGPNDLAARERLLGRIGD